MGAWDLINTCDATTFDDITDHYDEEIVKQEESGYCYDDPYCANITSFGGIALIEGIAENYEAAKEIILSNTQKWGIAKAKLYYPENFNVTKADIKKKISKITKVRKKINKEKQKIITKLTTFRDKVKSTESKKFITCYSCKSKIAKAYLNKCLKIEEGGYITNKCVICHNKFVNINDTKLESIKEDYKKLPPLYKAAYGGWVAS